MNFSMNRSFEGSCHTFSQKWSFFSSFIFFENMISNPIFFHGIPRIMLKTNEKTQEMVRFYIFGQLYVSCKNLICIFEFKQNFKKLHRFARSETIIYQKYHVLALWWYMGQLRQIPATSVFDLSKYIPSMEINIENLKGQKMMQNNLEKHVILSNYVHKIEWLKDKQANDAPL